MSAALDDEAAAMWLVSVTESTEADGALLVANGTFLCVDCVALDVGADKVEVDEVVV